MASEVITALRRISVRGPKIVSLEEKNQISVGRSQDADCQLASVNISRKHAILEKGDDGWTVKDLKSLNGVRVNDQPLAPEVGKLIKNGDVIQFGVPTVPGKPAEFRYQFCRQLKVLRPNASMDTSSQGKVEGEQNKCSKPELKHEDSECTVGGSQQPGSSREAPCTSREASSPARKRPSDQQRGSPSPKKVRFNELETPERLLQRKIEQVELEAQERLQKAQQQLLELQEALKKKESEQQRMQSEMEARELQLQQEMIDKEAALESERVTAEKEMRVQFAEELAEREASLLCSLQAQKDVLQQEKLDVEKQLAGKDNQLKEELLQERERLEKQLAAKEAEQSALQEQLEENSKNREAESESSALQAKALVLADFSELMETELQCAICNELFIQATSLQCGHAFCSWCLKQWRLKKPECPLCRAKIVTETRAIVLDSYIDKMLQHLSEDMKKRRQEEVDDRKRQEEAAKAEQEAALAARGRGARRGARGGRAARRGGAAARGAARGAATNPPTRAAGERAPSPGRAGAAPTGTPGPAHTGTPGPATTGTPDPAEGAVVVSSSNESDSESYYNSDDNSSSSSVDGYAYYGGYGRCYSCGRRGHWANGCPYY